MQYEEIKTLEPEERNARIVTEQKNLEALRFAHAISPIQNPMRIRHTRKLIARLKTAENASKNLNIIQS